MAEQPEKKKKYNLYFGNYLPANEMFDAKDFVEKEPIGSDTLGSSLFRYNSNNIPKDKRILDWGKNPEAVYPIDVVRSALPTYTALQKAKLPKGSYISLVTTPQYAKKITKEMARLQAYKDFVDYQRQHPISKVPPLPFEIQRNDPYAGQAMYDGAVTGYGIPPWLYLEK